MTCTKGQDLRRYIVEYHERPSGDKIVVDEFLEGGQYVPARISTLGGKNPGEERSRGGVARPSVRADERTRTAYPCSLRVMIHMLLGLAGVCKSRISRRLSLLRLAVCCTVLRSQGCQTGVKIALVCTSTSGYFVLAIPVYLDSPAQPGKLEGFPEAVENFSLFPTLGRSGA